MNAKAGAQEFSRSARALRRTVALVSLALLAAGCRSPMPQTARQAGGPAANRFDTLPGEAWTGAPSGAPPQERLNVNPGAHLGIPLPQVNIAPWSPPGIQGPWPADEYLEDGGDRDVQVTVAPNFRVGGLDMEDTVVHYDTIDGQTIVKPSNKVCIYAPRFGAVRKVTSVEISEQRDQVVQAGAPVKLGIQDETLRATTAVQPVQPVANIGTKQLSIERLKQPAVPISQLLMAYAVEDRLKAYEDFAVIRNGVLEEAQKPRLAIAVDAALTWAQNQAVQVVLDHKQAIALTGDQRVQTTFRADTPNNPCLRVIKVASANTAKPGDVIDFTIRFDNVGDQTIGNVTLIDSLTTRLEYVEGSAQASREAQFLPELNEGDSLTLRWEFTDPLPASGGGLVRFQCRVR